MKNQNLKKIINLVWVILTSLIITILMFIKNNILPVSSNKIEQNILVKISNVYDFVNYFVQELRKEFPPLDIKIILVQKSYTLILITKQSLHNQIVISNEAQPIFKYNFILNKSITLAENYINFKYFLEKKGII